MSLRPLGQYVVSGKGWQSGDPTWVSKWDKGSTSFPAAGSSGTNAPTNKTDGRATMQFICIHDPNDTLQMYTDHFERFLFRVLNEEDINRSALLEIQDVVSSAKRAKGFRYDDPVSRSMYSNNPTYPVLEGYPVCRLYSYQQLNLILAKHTLENGKELTRMDVFNRVKPIGIDVTPEATSRLNQGAMEDVRVLVVSGPQHTVNEFGKNIVEGWNIWAVFTPHRLTRETENIAYRGSAKQGTFTMVKYTKPKDGVEPRYFWQVHLVCDECRPSNTVLDLLDHPKDPVLVQGFSLRLGRLHHIFPQSHNNLNAFFGKAPGNPTDKASGAGFLPRDRDMTSSQYQTYVNVFVDCHNNVLK